MSWTHERIEDLKRLWATGHSASQIGKALGVSKNAVIGKAHRLDLPARPSPIRADRHRQRPLQRSKPRIPTPPSRAALAPAPRVAPAVEVPAPKPAPRPVRMKAAAGGRGCLWPIGDPGDADFHFCGGEAVPSKPYCDEHCARAYIVKSRDRSEAA